MKALVFLLQVASQQDLLLDLLKDNMMTERDRTRRKNAFLYIKKKKYYMNLVYLVHSS
jgi:hypothetical protein